LVPPTVLVVLAAAGVAIAAEASRNRPLNSEAVGPQSDGSYLTPVNQFLTPAGSTIRYDAGRLQDTGISPDGRTAVSLAWHHFSGSFAVFDLVHQRLLQHYTPPSGTGSGDVSFRGVLWSRDGRTVWVAQSGNPLRFPVSSNRTLGTPTVVALPVVAGRSAIPAGLTWAPSGDKLLVTLNALNTLAVVDAGTGAVDAQIPVGNAPRDVVVVGDRAYVANQGGRRANLRDFVNDSYGTPVVSETTDGRAISGTVSEVDLAAGKAVAAYPTGLQPTSLVAHGTDLLVTDSNDDCVTVIDTVGKKVGQTINVNPAPGQKYGASPNSLTFLDDTHLAVSLGRDNAVAVYAYHGTYRATSFEGLIPTAWYPGTIQWDSTLHRLVVTNLKGVGARGPKSTLDKGPGTRPATGHNTYDETGVISLVPVPTPATMARFTEQVFKNNQWNGLAARNQSGIGKAAPVAVPVHLGDPSTIKHVFLIVKENRTYDQVLGDDPRGNGAHSLAQFGRRVTPNHHALSTQFPLIDNLYGGGTVSADGHNWLTQAFVNDYIEREFGNFIRSYPASGADPLAYAKSGFLWDDVLRHGLTVRSWGEYANYFEGPHGATPVGIWQQWYRDSQILEGKAKGKLHVPVGYYLSSTDVPSLEKHLDKPFPNFQLQIPDQYRADLFQRDFANYVRSGKLPSLNMMWVMCDHTSGTAPGFPTPAAQVADNDLATGRIIDTISHSKYWKNTVVFVIEDDTQNGVDHTDGHRNVALIATPYAKSGVVHRYYSQLNMVRTIEQILGLPPMNQLDLAAVPMSDAFTNKPDFAPYDVRPNEIPLDTLSRPAGSLSGPAKAWAQWAAQQDFRSEDMANMAQLNRDIWYGSNGFARPYPGDTKVLLPNQVPGGNHGPGQQSAADTGHADPDG
jgi:YVTN family beta-propeller protein